MKLAVIGSRGFTNYNRLVRALKELPATEILVAGNNPAASHAAWYAATKGLPVREFTADPAQFGRQANRIRNEQLVEAADVVLAFWDGQSSGAAHMIEYAHELFKRVVVLPA